MPSNEEKSSDSASVDFSESLESKRINLMEERDYISNMPDSIIHHILSLLPSTKQAVKTGILSKRWKNQWTHVPVLVFKSEEFALPYKCLSMIRHVLSLYQCSRVMKFECFTTDGLEDNLSLASHFATERNVEELILIHHLCYRELPKLLFNIASLVRLHLNGYSFQPNECVKWARLKALELSDCNLSGEGIQNALLGSPLLETLHLFYVRCLDPLVISSKSLQELMVRPDCLVTITEISCPNLQKFKCGLCKLRGQVIQNISSSSPLLESLKLTYCRLFGIKQLGISSKSLKMLSLGGIEFRNDADDDDYGFAREISCKLKLFEVSCPNLEKLKLSGEFDSLPCTVMNLPSLAGATLSCQSSKRWVEHILRQLEHVKELTICHTSLKVLSNAEETCMSSPLLNKSLILKLDCLDELCDGTAWALQNFHLLEELAVKIPESLYACPDWNENYWDSCNAVFGSVESHLRVVKIINSSKPNGHCEVALNFIEFLLKHGKVLEKLVVILKLSVADFRGEAYEKLKHSEADFRSEVYRKLEDFRSEVYRKLEADFRSEVYRKLLSFKKCSQHVVVELV